MRLHHAAEAMLGFCLLFFMAGCVAAPGPETFFQPVSLEQRQIRSRLFETGDEIEIVSGLQEGDTIAILGASNLTEGMKVRHQGD